MQREERILHLSSGEHAHSLGCSWKDRVYRFYITVAPLPIFSLSLQPFLALLQCEANDPIPMSSAARAFCLHVYSQTYTPCEKEGFFLMRQGTKRLLFSQRAPEPQPRLQSMHELIAPHRGLGELAIVSPWCVCQAWPPPHQHFSPSQVSSCKTS